jgi:hypothetical protein
MKPQKTQKYAEILDRLASDNLGTTYVEALKRIVLASFSVFLRFQRQIIGGRNGVRTLFWGVELGEDAEVGRPKRADEAGGMDHSLKQGKARSTRFHKPEDDDAFEQILAEGREPYACRMLAYPFMPNHGHFVLQPMEDGGMSNFLR